MLNALPNTHSKLALELPFGTTSFWLRESAVRLSALAGSCEEQVRPTRLLMPPPLVTRCTGDSAMAGESRTRAACVGKLSWEHAHTVTVIRMTRISARERMRARLSKFSEGTGMVEFRGAVMVLLYSGPPALLLSIASRAVVRHATDLLIFRPHTHLGVRKTSAENIAF